MSKKDLDGIFDRLTSFKEYLEDNLPNHDHKHYDELMDIIDLFEARLDTYVNDYYSSMLNK